MSNLTIKYNDFNFEKEIELCECGGNLSFIYNDKLLYFQTPFL
jgi:hypothetical protein